MRRSVVVAIGLLILSVSAYSQPPESVRVTSNQADAAGCTSVGMVHGKVDTFWMQNTASLYSQLRAKAAKMGANLVVLIGGVTTVKQSNGSDLMADGEAYICGDRLAPSASPSAPAAAKSSTPPPNASNTSCGRNFTSKGSMLRGTTFYTFADFANVDRETAVDRLLARLPEEQLTLVNANKATGAIQTTSSTPKGRTFPVDLAVAQTAQGVRVAGTIKLGVGIGSDDNAIRDELCKILATVAQPTTTSVESVAVASAPPKAAIDASPAKSASAAAPAKGTVEERLQRLEQLFKKGLISADEYKKKKEEILKDI